MTPVTLNPSQSARRVLELARETGFAHAGIAPAVELPRRAYVDAWLAAGRHGEMAYLQRHHPMRMDPRNLLADARSLVVVADLYHQPALPTASSSGGPVGRVAQYAWGRDYHRVVRRKLKRLATAMRVELGEFASRICVDTAPLLEREAAALAGIGWIGRNTLVLHPSLGSYFFLGVLITSLDLQPSPAITDHCGSCTRCLDACPTQAFPAPYQMDATRCISYLTIEHRSDIAPDLAQRMGDWFYGCDICQEVCPFNRKAPLAVEPAYAAPLANPLSPRAHLDPIEVLTPEAQAQFLQGSAMKRATPEMMRRNARVVRDNQRSQAL